MRVVLYADDMEPITVIELSEVAARFLGKNGMVQLPVMLPPPTSALDAGPLQPWDHALRVVTIFAELLIRRDRPHMMLFTNDEESALLLKCAFLPGQQAGLQERERQAFARGFLDALTRVGGAP